MPTSDLADSALFRDEPPEWVHKWREKMKPGDLTKPVHEDDNLGAKANLVTDSRLTWLIDYVNSMLWNCHVYYKVINHTNASFKVEVLVFAYVDGGLFSANMRTSDISSAAEMRKVKDSAVELANGIAKQLGVQIFFGSGKKLGVNDIPMFSEPA